MSNNSIYGLCWRYSIYVLVFRWDCAYWEDSAWVIIVGECFKCSRILSYDLKLLLLRLYRINLELQIIYFLLLLINLIYLFEEKYIIKRRNLFIQNNLYLYHDCDTISSSFMENLYLLNNFLFRFYSSI